MIPTKEMVRACYELLCATPPFNRWALPPASKVKFAVTRHKDRSADWYYDGTHHIRVSANRHAYLPALLVSVAHEIGHIRQWQRNAKEGEHGLEWQRAADLICKHHGFDRGQF